VTLSATVQLDEIIVLTFTAVSMVHGLGRANTLTLVLSFSATSTLLLELIASEKPSVIRSWELGFQNSI